MFSRSPLAISTRIPACDTLLAVVYFECMPPRPKALFSTLILLTQIGVPCATRRMISDCGSFRGWPLGIPSILESTYEGCQHPSSGRSVPLSSSLSVNISSVTLTVSFSLTMGSTSFSQHPPSCRHAGSRIVRQASEVLLTSSAPDLHGCELAEQVVVETHELHLPLRQSTADAAPLSRASGQPLTSVVPQATAPEETRITSYPCFLSLRYLIDECRHTGDVELPVPCLVSTFEPTLIAQFFSSLR